MKQNFNLNGHLIRIIFLLVISCSMQGVVAQENNQQASGSKDTWQFPVEPYLLLPNMSGTTGVGNLLADVDASSSDIFGSLKMGAMLYLEATKGKWTIASDFLYMNLEQDLKSSTLINSGKVNAKQMGWELAGLRRINSWLELGAGALINSLEVDMEVMKNQVGGNPVSQSGAQSKTWVDPMLIARLTSNPANKVTGQLRGEIGGFGIGSDMAWQVQALAGYRFSKLFDLSAGYRAISLDYSSGEGNKTFIYDVVTQGPVVKFGFSF